MTGKSKRLFFVFRIWNFNEEAGFSQVLELGLPHSVVPGSANGNLLISGGLHLPLYTFQPESNEQWESVWKDSQLSAAAARLAPLLALEHIPHLIGENERENILKRLPEQVINYTYAHPKKFVYNRIDHKVRLVFIDKLQIGIYSIRKIK